MDIVDRLFSLADEKYAEQREFARALGVPPSVVSAWRRRKSASFNKRLPEIAELLGTTVEYLLTGKEQEAPPGGGPASKADMQAAFWGGDRDLSQEDMDAMWDDVERFAQFLADKKRQERMKGD